MRKTRTMPFADRIAGAIGMLFGGVAFYLSTHFKQFRNVPVGPEVFPQIMASGLILCSAALVIRSFLVKDTKQAPTLSLRDKGMRHMLMTVGIVVVFIVLWDIAGFLILSPLGLFALMAITGFRSYPKMALIALVLSALVWLLFWQVLSIELPLGPFGFLY